MALPPTKDRPVSSCKSVRLAARYGSRGGARALRSPRVRTAVRFNRGPCALFGQPELLRGAHLMKLRYEARASISFADKVLAICGIGLAAA
jgi:hypothetical protein